jgi:acyl CoA:acetate/3-ketoacid CoA transferase alpha subunit
MTMIADGPDDLVARFVEPDMHVHLAMTAARPNAATLALARRFAGRGSLTVSMAAVYSSAHALALSGAVDRMITCFLGDTFPTPRPNALYRDLRQGRPFRVEMWSLLSLVQRLMSGAMGLPYAVTGSLWESDLLLDKEETVFAMPDPAGGRPLLLAAAMRPDVTVVHGLCADSRGNVVLAAPLGEGAWSAYAAKRGVLATVERIVPDAVIDASPDRVVIPGQRVIALCEAHRGAHPQSLRSDGTGGVEGYGDDFEFLDEIARCGRTVEAMRQWYQDWVVDTGSHDRYLAKLANFTPVQRQRRPAGDPTDLERTIVLAARCVEQAVIDGGYDTLLAGIGPSHLATWLAADRLRERGIDVKVCAELGFYGQQPAAGDVFLFSLAHAAEQLAGIPEVLGGMVAGNSRCLGVLSVAEIDPTGDINTCVLPDGRWITGSGGANDIASSVDCVVVASASPRRYVAEVAHVTSPGRNVREVVSQFGRFRRQPGAKLRLATWLPGGHTSPHDAVAACTRWPDLTDSVTTEPDITGDEMRALRRVDPDGRYR